MSMMRFLGRTVVLLIISSFVRKTHGLTERQILTKLYKTANGERWNKPDNWLNEQIGICSWYGITCMEQTGEGDSHVTIINLMKNGLSGSLPPEIFALPYLRDLTLKNNYLEDFTFHGIENSTSLEHLNLSSNGIRSIKGIHKVPPSVKTIHLTSNKLDGHLPKELFQLINVQHVYLSYNYFTGSVPASIGKLTNLKKLYLLENALTGELPTELGLLNQLEVLTLAENHFTGTLPSEMNNLVNLRQLSFHRTSNIKEQTPGLSGHLLDFANFTSLTDLYLDGNSFSGTLPETLLVNSVVAAKDIISITLNNNQLTGSIPLAYASRFFNLDLEVTGNKISYIPQEICEMGAWMSGDVSVYQCNSILCPIGTYNDIGRQTEDLECLPCPLSDYYGTLHCEQDGDYQPLTEKEILEKLYKETDGINWKNSLKWENDTDICVWYGIFCDDEHHVQQIDLSKNNLVGTVPRDVYHLQHITHLILGSNRKLTLPFQGIFQAGLLRNLFLSETSTKDLTGIHQASSLKVLHLSSNDIKGAFPTEILTLQKLERLHVNFNQLSGPLPTLIGNLENLELLHLYGNHLSGELPTNLGNLKKLNHLDLSQNRFTGTLPETLEDLALLRDISIRQNDQDGIGLIGPLPSFEKMTNIKLIYLDSNNFSGQIPSNFLSGVSNNTEPITVGLSFNTLKGTVPSELKALQNLNIDLTGNSITGIATDLCQMSKWMDGAVSEFQCAAILCPPGSYNVDGFQSSENTPCDPCDTSKVYGTVYCEPEPPTKPKINSEKEILEYIYNTMNGEQWTEQSYWMKEGVHICNWYGITCREDGVNEGVERIILEKNTLLGTLPSEIFNMPFLKELSLKHNYIDVNFDNIGNASMLVTLMLSDTGLESIAGIGKATTLKHLHLTDNLLVGTIPDEIFDLVNLEEVFISFNYFLKQIPTQIGQLVNLRKFYCYKNKLTGQIPEEIENLTHLSELILGENELSGFLPLALESMVNLTDISFFKQKGPGFVGPLMNFSLHENLRALNLAYNSLTGPIPTYFMDASSLTTQHVKVDLRGNSLTGEIPLWLDRFDNLDIFLSDNYITSIPTELCKKNNWMNGAVSEFGCDAILCPSGHSHFLGRQVSLDSKCLPCESGEAFFFGSTQCTPPAQKQLLKEKKIIEMLYNSLNGENWKEQVNWNKHDVEICEWFGITCSLDRYKAGVVEIRLPSNGLSGYVPDEIFSLSLLKKLDLKNNDVDISFESIGNATNMEYLKLSSTQLKSISGIGKAKGLRELHLTHNSLTGEIPDELYDLKKLEHLFLSFNSFAGELSPKIGDLVNLKELYCLDNKLQGPIPTEIGLMTQLVTLALARNAFTGSLPKELGNLANIESISFFNQTTWGISGQLPDFASNVKLRELFLDLNAFTGSIPDTFLEAVQLSQPILVTLRENQLTGTVPVELDRLKSLEIDLTGNYISGIPAELCDGNNAGWMSGDVGNFGCDAILCNLGSFNSMGRQDSTENSCKPCTGTTVAPVLGSTQCRSIERYVLEIFFEAMGGKYWKNNQNWMDADDICSWYGITCETEGNTSGGVIAIQMRRNKLTGHVPPDIFLLPSLKELKLSHNRIEFDFEGIEHAQSLVNLGLSGVGLSSIDGVENAIKLKELHLTENQISGPLPPGLFELTDMENLYLSYNEFSGTIPETIGNLKSLKKFFCFENKLWGRIPSNIGKLTDLSDLVLGENMLSGSLPKELENLSKLETFSLYHRKSGLGINGPLPDFSKNKALNQLFLDFNMLTGSIPNDFLANVDTNKSIHVTLGHNLLTGTVPVGLDRFKSLSIDLISNKIVGLSSELCDSNNAKWMNGSVADFGCSAILCPPGTFNNLGRQEKSGVPCKSCERSTIASYFGTTQCTLSERDVLISLYNSCGGDNWTINTNWTTPESHICTWHGIDCNEEKSVVAIWLGSNNLKGTPPQGIYELPNLSWLWLYSNDIDFDFKNIGKAKKLFSLLLDSTGISSVKGIGAAKSITELGLRFNQMTGPFPDEILQLHSINSLDIADNYLTGNMPGSLEDLRNLRRLRLGSNQFSGKLLAFDKEPSLVYLDLSDNDLTGSISSTFLKHANGKPSIFVDLSSNILTGSVPNILDKSMSLTVFLRGNKFDAIHPELCNHTDWNDGDVASYGCDAIVCAPGTFNEIGRQRSSDSPCINCPDAEYYGEVTCDAIVENSGSWRFLQNHDVMLMMMLSCSCWFILFS